MTVFSMLCMVDFIVHILILFTINGRWLIKCKAFQSKIIFVVVTCTALSPPSNGQISYNEPSMTYGEYPVDTKASFTCNQGYSLSGSESRTCETSGNWNQETPTCNQSNECNILL